jgi:flagellar basal-body rod protein FlgB
MNGVGRMGMMDVLGSALGGAALRRTLLADNIANADTPRYKRVDTTFFETLKSELGAKPGLALAKTDTRHLPDPRSDGSLKRPAVYTEMGTSERLDGNNVDIEFEMANLAETTILYDLLVRELSSRISILRTAIFEGRR